jgi:hypothetical protein
MDLLQAILQAQNGQAVDEMATSLGLDRDQTISAIQGLLPALAGGMAQNASQPDGLASLEAALTGGSHARYLDNPSQMSQAAGILDGNSILGHILGNKDMSRNVAANAATQTGLSPDLLKKMLPMLATLVMGVLASRANRGSSGNVQLGQPAGGGGLLDMLGPILGGGGGGGAGAPAGGGLGDLLGGLFRR